MATESKPIDDASPGFTPGARSRKRIGMQQHRCGMQVTRGADYAIRVMICLVLCSQNANNTLRSLVEATGAPESFLSKILQSLCRAGFVTSRRGQVGGFSVLPAGRNASLADIVEAIDGPFRLNGCLSSTMPCNRKATCAAHALWIQAQDAMVSVLRSHTIAELATPTSAPQV